MKASIVIPTYNSEKTIGRCLESIKKQDYYELLVVDGNSKDGTARIAKEMGAKVFYENVGTRAAACNVGIKKSKGDIIAFTDADCVIDKKWLAELLKHFKNSRVACVGGPNFVPDDDSDFAKCVDLVLRFMGGLGARYTFNKMVVTETFHNPGCNVAYRKSIFNKVGIFREKLKTCEDEEMDYRVIKTGYKILYTPNAVVYHYRRPTWKGFFKQARNYAIGRAQAIKLHPDMLKWFHLVPLILPLLYLILLILSPPIFIFSVLLSFALLLIISLYVASKFKIEYFWIVGLLLVIWFAGWAKGFSIGLFREV
jgi:cellulose synthase/poly-beta-1,6-N-acetylglucosamine synthase-like glycosyltransferase